MKEILAQLAVSGFYPSVTERARLLLVVTRHAHAKLKERIESGEGLPQYVKDHPIYYAGPAKRQQVIRPAL